MGITLSDGEREELREAFGLKLVEVGMEFDRLEAEGELTPDGLERLALEATGPGRDAAAPTELGGLTIEAIEGLGGRAGALLLAAVELLVPGLATAAREALGRLGASGVPLPGLPAGTGELRLAEAKRYRRQDEDLYLLLLKRPAIAGPQPGARWQVACVPIDREDGTVFEGFLTPADLEGAARDLLEAPEEGAAPDPERVAPVEIGRALRRAAARNRERGWPIRWELGLALPLLARALCDDPASLGGLRIIPEGGELWADPEDADDFERLSEATLGDYESHLEEIGRLAEAGTESAAPLQDVDALRRSGVFVARTMLEWKWGLDGRMGQWTVENVEELLLDHAPRKLPSDEETIADTPACVAAFIDFLSGIRMLSGDLAGTLVACCEDLCEEFAEEMRDRSRWGPAKAVAAQMRADDVDLESREEVDAWIADFNARPRAERDTAFDSAVDRSVAEALTGDPEAPPPWEIGAALGGREDRPALAITWFPADEYRPALERWEELGERWHGVGHGEYVRGMEATFRGWERAGHRPRLVAVRLDDYIPWCEAGGHNPAEARPTYAAAMLEAGEATTWPPARNEPCWCGSGVKYKRCCGTVDAATLDPLAAVGSAG